MKKIFLTLLSALWVVVVMADVPLVYTVENTGANSPAPLMPTVDELPSIVRLPNPFEFADGSKFVTSFDDWKDRRAEIKAEIEHYEIGVKPTLPAGAVTATFDAGTSTLTVTVTDNGKTLTLTSTVVMPTGNGPFPVIIGMNSPTGSLPASLFDGFIQIPYMHNQVTVYGVGRPLTGPFFDMYPDLAANGQYSAWSWGISRLIDGLELVKDQMHADVSHIGITGCSYAGKMALFGGAFDERIALTIAEESGGGGICSWRVSELLGNVETLGATDYKWFMQSLRDNFFGKVDRLPYDHHELIGMIAPRAFLALGNDGWDWLGDESGYTSCMAAREIYKLFGIKDRFGFDFTGNHNHCAPPQSQLDASKLFIDKFLRGDNSVNTDSVMIVPANPASYATDPNPDTKNRYNRYQFWISDWANVTVPDVPVEEKWYEAESETCASIGADLAVTADANASNGKYVTVKAGLSNSSAPAARGLISIPFTTSNNRDFDIYFRMNCSSDMADALWVRLDNGSFVTYDAVNTDGNYEWVKVTTATLLAGLHKISIGFAKEGVKLDRINITNDPTAVPAGMGGDETVCSAVPKYTTLDFETGNLTGWSLQNQGSQISITQENVHSGKYAMKMVNANPAGSEPWRLQAVSPAVPIISGNTYDVSFWVKAVDRVETDGPVGRISTDNGAGLGGLYWPDFTVTDDAWTQITYSDLVATNGTVKLGFDMGYIKSKTYYIDDIVFDNLAVEDPNNLVKNGIFASTDNWTLNQGVYYGNTTATWGVADNKATLDITKDGTEYYQPQLVQTKIPLEAGMKYRLSFTASATAPRPMEVLIQMAGAPYTAYVDSVFNLAETSQSFMIEFDMAVSDPGIQLAFNLGIKGGGQSAPSITLSKVKLLSEGESSGMGIKKISTKTSNLRIYAQNSAVNVNFTATGSGKTELKLYSAIGSLIASTQLQTVAGQNYTYTFNQGNLSSGVYLVLMNGNGIIERAKVVMPN